MPEPWWRLRPPTNPAWAAATRHLPHPKTGRPLKKSPKPGSACNQSLQSAPLRGNPHPACVPGAGCRSNCGSMRLPAGCTRLRRPHRFWIRRGQPHGADRLNLPAKESLPVPSAHRAADAAQTNLPSRCGRPADRDRGTQPLSPLLQWSAALARSLRRS